MTKTTIEPESPETPVAAPVEDSGAVSLAPPVFVLPPEQKRTRYWFGVRDGAPFVTVTVGTIAFMRALGPVPIDEATSTPDVEADAKRDRGMIVDLTERQVEVLKTRIMERTFRRRIVKSDSYAPPSADGTPGKQRTAVLAEFRNVNRYIYNRETKTSTVAPFIATAECEWVGNSLYCVAMDSPVVKRLQEKYPESWRRRTDELPPLVAQRWVVPREPAASAA